MTYAIQLNMFRGMGNSAHVNTQAIKKYSPDINAPCLFMNQDCHQFLYLSPRTSFWNDRSLAGSGKLESMKCARLGQTRSTSISYTTFRLAHPR